MNPLEKYKHLYETELKKVDKKILSLGQGRPQLIQTLVSHIINSGGKRLRPILLILSAKLCSETPKNHIELAACVELLHTATLFHDDVVDESKFRRGRKTANELWGNSASVLVGDFLLAMSFEIMAKLGDMEVIEILSRTSSIITQGEVKQLMNKANIEISDVDYIDIITSKTAELFAATCRVGAITAGQNDDIKNHLEQFGRNLGIAFQIADDALDYDIESKKLGKTAGDDFREGKVTLPIILNYHRANDADKEYFRKIFSSSENERGEASLEKVLAIMNETNSLQDSLKEALKYSSDAKSFLKDINNSEYKSALIEILEFSVDRKF